MDVIAGVGVKVVACVLAMMTAFKTAFLARSYKAIKLFKTNVNIGVNTTLANLSECDYTGYAPLAVSSLNGPALDSQNNAYLTTPEAFFTHGAVGVGNQVFSAALVGTIAGSTAATGTASETGGVIDTVAITLAGGVYQAAPHVTVNDADGSGAIVTATINGDGEVDSLNIVDGGTGYTSPTLTIEPPVELVSGFTFQAPVSMIKPTDALPLVIQTNLLAGA